MALITVAVLSGGFGLVSIIVQHRVGSENRKDHATVTERLGDLKHDVLEIKADIREVSAAQRETTRDLKRHIQDEH